MRNTESKKQNTHLFRNKYEQKGITLIALIITIIIMLILVTVTISISLNGGLFGYAKDAVKETNQALTEEEMLANGMVKIDGIWYRSMEEYLKNPTITTVPEVDEGKWDYIHNGDGTITLTQYNGTETDLIVPNRYEGYVVTKVQSDKLELIYIDSIKDNLSKQHYNITGEKTNSTIEKVTISDGVEIGVDAFYRMTALENAQIGKNIIKIGGMAFRGANIKEINISEDMEEIGAHAISACTNLEKVNFSAAKSLKTIKFSAFSECSKLTDLDFSGATSLETIGASAFSKCPELTGNLVIPKGVKQIGNFAFNECSGLTERLVIPGSVKQIGVAAFQNCTGFTGIELNEGLEYIGDFAFNHVSKNKDTIIKIPSTVKQIGGQKYTGDSNTYGSHIFYDCGAYTAFEVAEGNTAYKAVDGVLYNKAGTVLVAYPQAKTGDRYEILEGVTKIDELALGQKRYLKTIVLPDSYEIKSTDEMPEGDYKINNGNNLSIGIYRWGVVESVEVKSTNAKYKSENGMVLSKDGTTLYYVPINNAGTGTIEIPSTVTKIYKGAIYGVSSGIGYTATKIVIPATCVSIDELDIKVINSQDWTIEVASGNTKYEVDSNGKLVAK